jgi:hypothetical protein
MSEWRKDWENAPKDRPILFSYSDISGCYYIHWGVYESDSSKEGWFEYRDDELVDEFPVEKGDYFSLLEIPKQRILPATMHYTRPALEEQIEKLLK